MTFRVESAPVAQCRYSQEQIIGPPKGTFELCIFLLSAPRIPLFVRPFITISSASWIYAYMHVSGSRIMHHASIQVFRRYMHHTCFHQMYASSWSGDAFNIHALVHHTYMHRRYKDTCINKSCIMDTCIIKSCIMDTCIKDICIIKICIMDSCIN